MAVFDLFRRRQHLDDAALAALWSDAYAAGTRPAHTHLDGCTECRGRYTAFTAWLEDVRGEAIAEANEAFPAERLAAQHSHILRRLEAMERPARVIRFPKFARPVSSSHSGARRWIAAAAAAGLLIGLVGGQMLDLRHRLDRTQPTFTSTSARNAPGPTSRAATPVSLTTDEAVLMELPGDPAASAFARIPEPLRALDGLTPHARDYDRVR